MSILINLSAAHAFDYIVLEVNPLLTSCEDLAIALYSKEQVIALLSCICMQFVITKLKRNKVDHKETHTLTYTCTHNV